MLYPYFQVSDLSKEFWKFIGIGKLRITLFLRDKLRASDAQIIEDLKQIIACQTASDVNDRPNIKRSVHFEYVCCPT